MLITIGGQTKRYMGILEIADYPFTKTILKSAYRRLILIHHPDKNNHKKDEAERMTIKIIEAYESLKHLAVDISNEEKRVELKKQEAAKEDIFAIYSTCEHCNGFGKLKRREYFGQCLNCIDHFNRLFKNHHSLFRLRSCAGRWCPIKTKIHYIRCPDCKGTGRIEVKPFNPVIPKGAVL